ncbi:hypothetical protein GCM10008983_20850 [Lentibacillus halophilus]|uniref:Uncharacterized protein n=1 Tax=Lentibacillus halophilus TaxID=295065 RepID=A0ABP3J9N0_9BACI
MTHFRKRFNADFVNDLNEHIVELRRKTKSQKQSKCDPSGHDDGPLSANGNESNKPEVNQTG